MKTPEKSTGLIRPQAVCLIEDGQLRDYRNDARMLQRIDLAEAVNYGLWLPRKMSEVIEHVREVLLPMSEGARGKKAQRKVFLTHLETRDARGKLTRYNDMVQLYVTAFNAENGWNGRLGIMRQIAQNPSLWPACREAMTEEVGSFVSLQDVKSALSCVFCGNQPMDMWGNLIPPELNCGLPSY